MECRRRRVFAAVAVLLLALLIPASASAGARVSEEAVARWESSYVGYEAQGIDAYEAMLAVFDGEEFDGAVVESFDLRIGRRNESSSTLEGTAVESFADLFRDPDELGPRVHAGVAALRFEDGTLVVFVLVEDEFGNWEISGRSGDLSGIGGVNRALVSHWHWTYINITLLEDEEPKCLLEFRGDFDELTLYRFTCEDSELARASIPSLSEVYFDSIWWGSDSYKAGERYNKMLRLEAERVYQKRVIEAEVRFDEETEFAVPFNGLEAAWLFSMLGERTEAGISFVDESSRMDTMIALRASGIAADAPVLPEPLDVAYALTEPELAHFAPGLRFDVYSGPGKDYLREEDGRASVSSDDWILVFGEESGWLMVLYRMNEKQLRFGWIEATQEQAGVDVSELTWVNEPVRIYGEVTNDPFYDASAIMDEWEKQSLSVSDGSLLGALGDTWAYVKTQTEDGEAVRGFVFNNRFYYNAAQSEECCVSLPRGESAALYDAPGGVEIGRLYPGATLFIREERDGMLYVIYYPVYNYDTRESLDLRVQGWIDERAVTRGQFGWSYIDEQEYAPARMVWIFNGDETPDDLAQCDLSVYALMAEVGDTAYVEISGDGIFGVQVPRSSLREMTYGVIAPTESGSEEESVVKLYVREDGATAVNDGQTEPCLILDEERQVFVLTRANGAALVLFYDDRAQFYLFGPWWVDERLVTGCEPVGASVSGKN